MINRSSSSFPAVMSALANLVDDQTGTSPPPHQQHDAMDLMLCIVSPFIPDLTYPFSGVF